MLCLLCVVLLCLNSPFIHMLLKMCLIVLYINDFFYFIVLLRLVLFRGFTKQTRLLASNKILIDSMLPYFIDTVVIQIKDIIE